MERLAFDKEIDYSAVEASIHLNRYAMAKSFCVGKAVLDVASGEGYGSSLLKKWGAISVDAIDVDLTTVEKAKRLFGMENIRFTCHTAEELPFPDNSFDLVTSFETIEHLDNPDKFLNEIKRVLKPEGIIIMSCPNDPYYYKEANASNPFHKRQYTYFDFRDLTEKYLGHNVKYFLSFAVNGFLNMPITRSTEPENVTKRDMLEMLNFVECSSAFWVPQERYANHWNCNYYVGIWGNYSEDFDISTVIYPRETFVEIKDEDIQLLKQISNQQDKLKDIEIKFAEVVKKLEDNANILADKEYSVYKLTNDCKELKMQVDALRIEKDRLATMFELRVKESISQNGQFSNYDGLVAAQNELAILKSTKGYKLLNLIYRVRCKFRRIK